MEVSAMCKASANESCRIYMVESSLFFTMWKLKIGCTRKIYYTLCLSALHLTSKLIFHLYYNIRIYTIVKQP